MRRTLFTVSILTLMASPSLAEAPGATIEATVGPLESAKGKVGCTLFASEAGFPSEASKALQRTTVAAAGKNVVCRFVGVPAGTYAISVMHDEDGDGELDSNLFGIPSEGYGASNNKLPSMSPPSFGDSSFAVSASGKKALRIKLKY